MLTLGAFLLNLFFPSLNFFSCLIVYSFYRLRRINVLWLALLAGFLNDLAAFSDPFIHIIAFPLSAFILYPQKQNFFIDSIST
ncbi:MAG: hypothetical protein ACK4HV_00450, partial [Parachlamydiaceae bacterium]